MPLRWIRCAASAAVLLAGCVSLPPGSDYPKPPSTAIERPLDTWLGGRIAQAGRAHSEKSGFRLLPSGSDGILARVQMADAAERSLDVQYYIYRDDDTSKLLSEALLRAADRGVRVRVLLDDHGAIRKHIITGLAVHPRIEVRLFNPFAYRGDSAMLRYIELVLNAPRLRYRMHNKLFVADNVAALVGGRNIGDEYFQASPEFEFGDYDVFAAGAIVRELSKTFDEFWASELAIPIAALEQHDEPAQALENYRRVLEAHRDAMTGTEYGRGIDAGQPLAGMLAPKGLAWAAAEVVHDSPLKALALGDELRSWLSHPAVVSAAAATKQEFLLVTPYLVPADEGMRFLTDLGQRHVHIRILTNALEATDVAAAHAGYARYRVALLKAGMELYEARSDLEKAGGGGTPLASGSSGRFSLHAKALVFDRTRVLIGAMNFDKRSLELNTELGLMIHSPALARQVARQFQSIANPANSYQVVLDDNGDDATAPRLLWRTERSGKIVELETEPVRNPWQRLTVDFLLALPLDVLVGESDYH